MRPAQEGRQAPRGVGERLGEAEGVEQAQEGGGFPAGQDEGVQARQVAGAAHGNRLAPQGLHHAGVLGHPSLEGEDADAPGTHQPRSARRCGAGTSATLMPTIASPRPRETSAMTAGSS